MLFSQFGGGGKLTSESRSKLSDLSQIPRRKWTEGLRDTPDGERTSSVGVGLAWRSEQLFYVDVSSAFFPGCTDMVHQWTSLGFVAKFDAEPLPAWLEVERELPHGYRPASMN